MIAVDWSGRRQGAAAHIWSAEVRAGELVALECGRTAPALASWLVGRAEREPRLAVGLDFAFSFPSWFLAALGVRSGPELWAVAERCGEAWLAGCPVPFWGRPARWRPPDLGGRDALRRTDRDTPATAGVRAKSPFQVGGAGSVGTGSIRGMPVLAVLRAAGFAIWPFDAVGPATWPRVVEIYPRLLTGNVAKAQEAARRRHAAALGWPPDPSQRAAVVRSDDAFDAAFSARAMARGARGLVDLPPVPPEAAVEGWIWSPGPSPTPPGSAPGGPPPGRAPRRRGSSAPRPGEPGSTGRTATPAAAPAGRPGAASGPR